MEIEKHGQSTEETVQFAWRVTRVIILKNPLLFKVEDPSVYRHKPIFYSFQVILL